MVEVLLLIEASNQFRMHEIPQLPPSPPPQSPTPLVKRLQHRPTQFMKTSLVFDAL